MSNPSNLYAEKVFGEHPLALWALDEKLDYLSLITESQRDIEAQWSIDGATAYSGEEIVGEPFKDSVTTVIKGDVPLVDTNEIICISPDLKNFSDLNASYGNFCIASYVYLDSIYTQSVSIGYEYTDSTSLIVYQNVKTFETDASSSWVFLSETFAIPDEVASFRAVIKINTINGGSTTDDYIYYVNGISVGQWSEEFNTSSLGVDTIVVPSSISTYGGMNAVKAFDYGIESNPGYYIASESLLARNTSIPLVFGASNITSLNVGTDASFIVPGKGFLNNKGKYNDYTVEFWTRINSDSFIDKRIFGPIGSTDGLYVNGAFLTLAIGNNFGSHFVGEWYRPMLIHIRFSKDTASLLINGEQVVSFNFNLDDLVFPNELDANGKNQDWLGFYSYEGITPFEIDCVAIYPYQVPITVSKRRFAYGQAVTSSESIDSSYGGTSTFIDYAFSGYASNYSYPDLAKWEQGTFDNLSTTSTTLSTPSYSLPNIYIEQKNISDLYLDNKIIQDEEHKFITFRPNSSWNNIHSYFNFNNFNIINEEINSMYGIFSSSETLSSEILFKIYNSTTKNYFYAKKEKDAIVYGLFYNGQEEKILSEYIFDAGFYNTTSWVYTIDGGIPSTIEWEAESEFVIVPNQKYIVGIDISKLITSNGGNVASFFGNRNGLKLYIAGDDDPDNSFTGKIYNFGISTKANKEIIKDNFNSQGFILDSSIEEMLFHTASYTLVPFERYNNYFLDINSNGYWQDYMPLSYFAKYITKSNGNKEYDLDFLQFNFDYPAPSILTEKEEISDWNYLDLKQEYQYPTQKTYEILDNLLITNFNDYLDLSQKSVKQYTYNTENSTVKTYITFQYIQDGANKTSSSFTSVEPVAENLVIDIDKFENWETIKFEIVNNSIIYPSKKIDFSKIAIVYHVEFNVFGIIKNPVSIKKLEIASQALSDNSFNAIGTRFGQDIIPYKKAGVYFDYKSKNPFSIYKGNSPYLYLTRYSGIKISDDNESTSQRGISIPINRSKASTYRINAVQLWMRYNELKFPLNESELFEINYKGDTIKFYIVSDNTSGNRGKIIAKSKLTNTEYFGISYYWNGILVKEPRVTKNEWGSLSIAFPESLNFDSYLGNINLTGLMLFNNISYYQSNNIQLIQKSITRPWTRVKNDGVVDLDWQYWLDNYNWKGLLVLSTIDLYGSSPTEIYKTYIGTNKIVIDDTQGMSFDSSNIKVYSNTSWQTQVKIPV